MTDIEKGSDILWGAEEIGAAIGRTARQTNFMMAKGSIPVKKVGGRWCASRDELLAFFKAQTETSTEPQKTAVA